MYYYVNAVFRACLFINQPPNYSGLSFLGQWICVTQHSSTTSSEFGMQHMVFTFGFIITIILVSILAFTKIDNNVLFTMICSCLAFSVGIQWITASILVGLQPQHVPIFAPLSSDYGQVLGVVMLNLVD